MYFRIDNDIIDKYGSELGAYGLAVYMCLARFTNADGLSWPSYETIAKRTGISRKQVIREVKKLEDLDLIEVTPQFNPETKENRSNLFALTRDSQSPPPRDSQSPPRDYKSPRSKLKKDPSTKVEGRRNYQPNYEETGEKKKYSVDFA
jgi:DNA-binding Lrp family transcriptional regulator